MEYNSSMNVKEAFWAYKRTLLKSGLPYLSIDDVNHLIHFASIEDFQAFDKLTNDLTPHDHTLNISSYVSEQGWTLWIREEDQHFTYMDKYPCMQEKLQVFNDTITKLKDLGIEIKSIPDVQDPLFDFSFVVDEYEYYKLCLVWDEHPDLYENEMFTMMACGQEMVHLSFNFKDFYFMNR